MNVLIVDDIEANLISLEYLLESYFKDIKVIKADCADVALKKCLESKIDIIILDVQMPKIDGFEVAKYLKLNKKTKDIPIIFLTAAYKKDEFVKRGFEIGAIDYLTKPIDENQFINRLRLYLEIFKKNSELKKLLEENSKKNRLLQAVIDLSKSMILVTKDEDILMLNKELMNFFGIKKIEDLESGFSSFVDTVTNFKVSDDNLTNKEKIKRFYDWIIDGEVGTKILNFSIDKNRYFNVEVSSSKDIDVFTFTDITKMHNENIYMTKKATHDSLTGVLNRERLNELLFEEICRAICDDVKFSCLLFDIDHFKKINDVYGHLTGDKVLKKFSKIVNGAVRKSDYFARWGGEEFILLLKNSSINEAKNIAEGLRELVQNSDFDSVEVTVSIGVSEYEGGDSIDTIIKRCDEALYRAKRNGRNRVEIG